MELDEKLWNEWVATRPPKIQDLCRKFPPNKLYRLKTSKHVVTIYSYGEDGTLTVDVTQEYNNDILFDRSVFGVDPDNLELVQEKP